ncbi:D-2-hydroxyacid dehydrogenase [Cobetia marina]|uniref:D-2-hydroxyacid dehydrogenase n=1 Tax=Cobetia marina TaxID=28258 RepID=UPI0010AE4ED5|nr:D-2-hydroxyacid dehydrogenase [Cobetia marina]TKD63911.1 D-2-hydroxyacid dehydrogenase [Cobetia marina]
MSDPQLASATPPTAAAGSGPQAVMLDMASLGDGLDFSRLKDRVNGLVCHDATLPEQVVERLEGAEIVLVNKVRLEAQHLEALPTLKLIAVMATGTNNIDMEAARAQGIRVMNVAAYGTASVAQHTWMLMLALAGQLPGYQGDVASGEWQRSNTFCLMGRPTLQLAGKHLVIVGKGELGTAVGRLAEAFDMRVTFAARPGSESTSQRPSLKHLLPEADVISLHCPLTPETHHLIDEQALALLKPGALLINCARGGIIDEEAALAALKRGHLGGLAVDSLPEEPPREGHALLTALANGRTASEAGWNLIVTPHNAWISREARQNILDLSLANIEAYLGENV